ncbi:MAG: glycoside hydrolase family 9 protein [Bacteroidales bacterium]|nr:glycoside hydrolase family 9 protein [Bacteroidales bacterium]
MENCKVKRRFILMVLMVTTSMYITNNLYSQNLSDYIVIDQFGYLPQSEKIAVIRDPQTGYDATESFTPGATYAVVDKNSLSQVLTGSPVAWNSGATDGSSGDKAWWFDFSSVTEPGTYYILDVSKNVRSFEFKISESIYNEVLRHAVRTFFYQRVGFEKEARYAGAGWADGASHLGDLQDLNCRIFNDRYNAETEKDLHGGWYDAGDYNKYTSWTANYVIEMMKAYLEKPEIWSDNFNIPESGNGTPDLLDEAKWGIDHLLRMQQTDGSVLSIVGLSHASPPSSATGRSLYGSPNTSSALNTSGAFAIASKAYRSVGMDAYADTLEARAIKAWDWAVTYPDSLFRNNDAAYGSSGLGAGQQEVDDYGRMAAKLEAACYLFDITGGPEYQNYFENNYQNLLLFTSNFAFPFQSDNQETALYYSTIPGASPSVAANIISTYKNAMNGSENFTAFYNEKDPYMAHIKDYTWGSNSIKSNQGNMFYDMITFEIDATKNEDSKKAAERYIHYLHGVNPLNMVYLSNMYEYGGDNGVNEFYHTWFTNGSVLWDRVGVSTYGPPPGFLTGGPNPSYDWDGCCPGDCGSTANNAVCTSEPITPPKGQPNQKSYKDFNTSWPLNSWSVTENSCGYQVNYIRLLSKFVEAGYDCNGDLDGTASFDVCGQCTGGNTGITPVTDESLCPAVSALSHEDKNEMVLYPNPADGIVHIKFDNTEPVDIIIYNAMGVEIKSIYNISDQSIDMSSFAPGIYIIQILSGNKKSESKIIML